MTNSLERIPFCEAESPSVNQESLQFYGTRRFIAMTFEAVAAVTMLNKLDAVYFTK